MSFLKDAQEKMQAAIEHLQSELKTIRTGRANPGMLDNVTLEVYGTQMRLRDTANITVPEPRQLLITPYDAGNVNVIAKGIDKANLGFQPIADGNVVRINIPEMNQELREEMAKVANKKREEAKIGVRHVRRDILDDVKKAKNDGDVSEDEQKRLEKEIQDLTDRFCQQADDLSQAKEKEIATI